MPSQEKIAQALGYIEQNYAVPAYLRRLAELGIIPENRAEVNLLVKMGEEAGELLRKYGNAEMEKSAADESASVDPYLLDAVKTIFGRD
jgi:hypothetical protein